jgi:predicted permease
MAATQESGRGADMRSSLGMLVFIVLPVVVVVLGVAVAAVLALGWVIQHVIA